MLANDLKELLMSIAEEDAIVSTLYSLFIVKKKYTPQIIEEIINYGISIGWFEVVDVNRGIKLDAKIAWKLDNNSQEILFCDMNVAVEQLFNDLDKIPSIFKKFVTSY